MQIFFAVGLNVFSQPFSPLSISGFNHDVVAEAGTSSLTTTTVSLDGFTVSNKVMYTDAFRILNGFGGGGIADDGIISDAAGSYQLAAYNSNNALLVQRNQNGDLQLSSPAQFNSIRALCFSTEGTSLLNINLFFSDGSSTTAFTNYSLGDWFDNIANLVISGFGRCTRATPASGADAFPNNPRMYFIEIPLSCTDRQKNLQRINFANVTTAGTNAPYPNAVFFAISGKAYTQNITDDITDASCTSNGSVTLDVTGSAGPFNISWNTIPVQNGPTATDLIPGNYEATITDVNGCITTYPVTIGGAVNNLTMTAHIDTAICYGASFNANTISNATSFSWSPTTGVSDPLSANPVLSPTDPSTLYTVTGTLGACTISRSFTVTVYPEIILIPHIDTTICSGASFNANTISNATDFSWTPITGVSDPNIANPLLSPADGITDYTVTGTTGNCSVSETFRVTTAPHITVNAGNPVSIIEGQSVQLNGSGDSGTYLWTPSTGLSATDILNPVASPIVTTTYVLSITSAQGYTETDDVQVTVEPYCLKPMNAITPNGDGINEKWLVSNGNCVGNAKVKVFNRYGSSVFESGNYQNDWEGTYKGKPLPDATYYFVIEYKLINGRLISLKGNLTILR